jgi:hypothetical protein
LLYISLATAEIRQIVYTPPSNPARGHTAAVGKR